MYNQEAAADSRCFYRVGFVSHFLHVGFCCSLLVGFLLIIHPFSVNYAVSSLLCRKYDDHNCKAWGVRTFYNAELFGCVGSHHKRLLIACWGT